MIFISKERLMPLYPNMITIESKDYYYYVSRKEIEESAVLRYKYNNKLSEMLKDFGTDIPIINDVFNILPEPIKWLAPFISLLEFEINPNDIEECVGALSIITGAISPIKYISIDKNIRSDVSFSLTIKEEIRLTHDNFLHNAIPFSTVENNLFNMVSDSINSKNDFNDEDLEDIQFIDSSKDPNLCQDPNNPQYFIDRDMIVPPYLESPKSNITPSKSSDNLDFDDILASL